MKENVSAMLNVWSIFAERCQGLHYLNYIVRLTKQLMLYSLAGQLLEQREWNNEASLRQLNINRQCSIKKGFFLRKSKNLSRW